MALVDPTINRDHPGNSRTLLENVQPDTAVYLQRVAPDATAFFYSHWDANVTTLDGPTYRNCFGGSRSNNPVGTNTIFLNGDLLPSPQLKAIAIAHELVHAEHGNPETPQGQYTLRHLFITEEGEAQLTNQVAAIRLHTKSLDSPLSTFIFDIGTLPLLYAWLLLFIVRIARFLRKAKTPALSLIPLPPHFPASR